MPNNFTSSPRSAALPRVRAFSLMEVLLAVFILGIGLIMVATIFPVGADWTRQSTEASVAQVVAQNALAVIRTAYAPTGVNAGQLATLPVPTSTTATVPLQALPGLNNAPPSTTYIPISERSYQFGNQSPFPATDPTKCTYFWTALARVQPGSAQGVARRYDLYILVFRKGDNTQLFGSSSAVASELAGARDSSDPTNPAMNHLLEPTLAYPTYTAGAAIPPVGWIGIGQQSGTVFRQSAVINYTTGATTITPVPALSSADTNVIYAPPADGTTSSPLIYVYQTTLSF